MSENNFFDTLSFLFSLLTDAGFVDLFPFRGQPAYAPWRLDLITIFQFFENLSERAAAEVVRSIIRWRLQSCNQCQSKRQLIFSTVQNSTYQPFSLAAT